MPKKKEKKKGGDGEKKKAEERKTTEERADFEPRERELFRIQIEHLTEQLERYHVKCDDLEQHRRLFDSRLAAVEKEKKDIVSYLKHAVLEKERELEQVSEQLEEQRQEAQQERRALDQELERSRRECQERVEAVSKENRALETRLQVTRQFERQREQMIRDTESLQQQLKLQEEQHRAQVHQLDMKVLLQNQRLQRELQKQQEAQAEHVQKTVEQQLPLVTRQVLRENAELRSDLVELKERTAGWMTESDELKTKNRQLRVEVENLEGLLKELNRQSCVRQRAVEQLTEKSQQLQQELDVCRRQHKQLQSQCQQQTAENDTLRQNQASLSQRCSQHGAERSRLEAELRKARRDKSLMDEIVQDASVTLRKSLMEAPERRSSEEDVSRWKNLMEKILVLLDSHTFEARAPTLDPDSSFRFQLARYRPGDLGFVPAPAPKHIHTRRRPGHIPPLLRKPSSHEKSRSADQCRV